MYKCIKILDEINYVGTINLLWKILNHFQYAKRPTVCNFSEHRSRVSYYREQSTAATPKKNPRSMPTRCHVMLVPMKSIYHILDSVKACQAVFGRKRLLSPINSFFTSSLHMNAWSFHSSNRSFWGGVRW